MFLITVKTIQGLRPAYLTNCKTTSEAKKIADSYGYKIHSYTGGGHKPGRYNIVLQG